MFARKGVFLKLPSGSERVIGMRGAVEVGASNLASFTARAKTGRNILVHLIGVVVVSFIFACSRGPNMSKQPVVVSKTAVFTCKMLEGMARYRSHNRSTRYRNDHSDMNHCSSFERSYVSIAAAVEVSILSRSTCRTEDVRPKWVRFM